MKNMTIIDYLEERVREYPDRRAVSDKDAVLTWKELQREAEAAGHVLGEFLEKGKPRGHLCGKDRPRALLHVRNGLRRRLLRFN